MREHATVKTAGMEAFMMDEGSSHRVRSSAASSSRDTRRKAFNKEDGRGDLTCSAYERTQDIKLEARETHAAAIETRLKRAPGGRVAQRTTRARCRAAKTAMAAC